MTSTATETAAHEAASSWQAEILQQLEQADTDGATHAVITRDEGDQAQLVDVAESENAAVVIAEDWSAKRPDDEFTIVPLKELQEWADASGFSERPAAVEPDVETGKLFEMPKIKIDTTQPTLLQLAFSGSINVSDRDDPRWVELYNDLRAGKTHELKITVYSAGANKRHRRDKEGDVDAVPETKSLIVTDVHLEGN